MILVCPSCDTRYFADDAAVGREGRRVRCASCGHSWFAKPQEESEVASSESTGLTREQVERLRQTAAENSAARTGPHSEFRAREHARRRRNRALAAAVAWIGGFALFAGTAAAAVVFRNEVAEAWPRTASLYRMVGLDVNRFGLSFVDVAAKRSFDGTTPVLTVTGVAVNEGKERRAAPEVRVSLKDEQGKEVHAWTDKLSAPSIGPGERVPFSSKVVAPPVETFGLEVTFARSDEAPAKHDAAGAESGHDGVIEPDASAEPGAPEGAHRASADAPWSGGDGDMVDGAAEDADHPAEAPAHPAGGEAAETTHH
jgi:predicted Zn finger-like uncharacterized protein